MDLKTLAQHKNSRTRERIEKEMARLLERYEPARDDWRSTLSRAYDLIMKHPLVKNQESQIEMLEDIVRQVLTKNSAYLPDDQVNRIKL